MENYLIFNVNYDNNLDKYIHFSYNKVIIHKIIE